MPSSFFATKNLRPFSQRRRLVFFVCQLVCCVEHLQQGGGALWEEPLELVVGQGGIWSFFTGEREEPGQDWPESSWAILHSHMVSRLLGA